MTLVKFTPMRDLLVTQNRLNHLFDSFFGEPWAGFGTETTRWSPRMDVEETKDAIVLRADVPGMDKKDMDISVEDNRLTLRGERKSESQVKDKSFHRIERSSGSFCRTFELPATVLPEKIQASYKDGVLEVVVPKAEAVKPRQIEIR